MTGPTSIPKPDAHAVRTAILVSGLGIGWQVAGRASRDALFLSHFDVTLLPRMVGVAAIVSLLSALAVGRLLSHHGPSRLAPVMYAGSTVVLLAAWGLLAVAPRVTAVVLFIHVSGFGALLVSIFWSLANERFDPRSAKKVFGQMSTAGTVGGVAGGLIAERMGALHSAGAMLLVLAAFHFAAWLLVMRMRALPSAGHERAGPAKAADGIRTLFASQFLVLIGVLAILSTVSEGLLDYVFKAAAKGAVSNGNDLLRLFALFYAAVNVLGIVIGTLLGKWSLERLGLARTVGLLPWSVAVTGAGALAMPGIGTALFARFSEAVTRNSLYRAGAELLLTPLPPPEKRAVKPLLDVGAPRIGDVGAALLVQLALVASVSHSRTIMLSLAVACAVACIALTFRVHKGYVTALERGLRSRALHLDVGQVRDRTTRHTMVTLTGHSRASGGSAFTAESDPVVQRLARLRSEDEDQVRNALSEGLLAPAHISQAIALLARTELANLTAEALSVAAGRHTGQLVDALLDSRTDEVVRRRLPAVLGRVRSVRAVDGLLGGLDDERFEVRFRCGRALARLLQAAPELAIEAAKVHAAVLREVAVDRVVWESQRTQPSDALEDAPVLDSVLRERASRSLEHVFTMLALVLPREPLQLAYHGIQSGDAQLRGTALEYLETALPAAIRIKLWPFLDADAGARQPARPREEVVAELLRSRASIAMSVEEIRRRDTGARKREG